MVCAKVSYYYRKNFADFSMNRMHTHSQNNYEIMYVFSGKCKVVTPDDKIHLKAGSFVMIGKCCPHMLIAQNADILNIEFYMNNEGVPVNDISLHYAGFSQVFSKRIEAYNDTSDVYTAMRELIEELQNYGEGVCSELLLKRLIIEICRVENNHITGSVSYINSAKDYIKEHFCEKIMISEIADKVGVNRSYLQSLFKQYTGKTIVEYINMLRIEKACFMIRNTDLSILDIAIDCGFSSRQHFTYVFKKYVRCNAGEYRKQ